jgi:prevent-host-death family protein
LPRVREPKLEAADSFSVDVREAQTHLRELLDRVNAGVQIILSENEKPIARLVPDSEKIAGLHAGSIWSSDGFDEPLPDTF